MIPNKTLTEVKSMPYIVGTCWYPPTKAEEVAKKYLEIVQKKFPFKSFEKLVIPACSIATKDGLKVLVIVEVKRENLGESLTLTAQRYLEAATIEEFRYDIRVGTTLQEGFEALGMG